MPINTNKNISPGQPRWRFTYPLISGIVFMLLGVAIFVRAKGLSNFFSAGLFALLIGGYGVYRVIMFYRLWKQRKDKAG